MAREVLFPAERRRRRIRLFRILAAIVALLLLPVAFYVAVEWGESSTRIRQRAQALRYQICQQACQQAGFMTPHWRPCARWIQCFYCADERGVLTPEVAPGCCQYQLSAGSPDYDEFLERCGKTDPMPPVEGTRSRPE
jgi:hypothetical protein